MTETSLGRVFVIADTHFGDEDIRLYEERPFRDVREMDEEMIRRWNAAVSEDDLVWHLGDFSSYDLEQNRSVLSRLNGRKRLIMGNHDLRCTPAQWRAIGFEECYDLPVIYGSFFLLSHEPLYVCRSMPYANLYGHVHSSPTYNDISCRSACVSVERTGYAPVLIDELREKMQALNR